jgi:hypothetical protein
MKLFLSPAQREEFNTLSGHEYITVSLGMIMSRLPQVYHECAPLHIVTDGIEWTAFYMDSYRTYASASAPELIDTLFNLYKQTNH